MSEWQERPKPPGWPGEEAQAEDESPAQEEEAPRRVLVQGPQVPPRVTYGIMAVTIAVFVLQLAGEYLLGGDVVANLGVKDNQLIMQGQLWRLFTPMLLHAGFLHIGFNMYALYVLGPELERHYGHGPFLALYVVSGFAGVVASFALTEAPSLGASTAVFGLLGAQGVFAYQNQEVFGAQARRALRGIVHIAIINFLIGLSPGIDNWGHMGGLVGGSLMAWFGGPVYRLGGMMPSLRLENTRGPGEVARAGLVVMAVFGLVVLGVMGL